MASCPTCGESFDSESGMKIHHAQTHDKSIAGVLSSCNVCGEEFRHPRTDPGSFCSKTCQSDWQSGAYSGSGNPNPADKETLTCPICEEDFEVVSSQSERRRCCSTTCMGEWQSRKRVGESHPNYVEKVTVECWTCGAEMERNPSLVEPYEHHFCDSGCYGDFVSENLSGKSHYKYKPDELTEYGSGWDEDKRERVRERDNRKCQHCGSGAKGQCEKLDVHHIQPADSFEDDEKRNAMENLISLCRACHPTWEKMAPLRPTK